MSVVHKALRGYRRWNDRDVLRAKKPISVVLPIGCATIAFFILSPNMDRDKTIIIVLSLMPFAIWQAWVISRVIRMLRVVEWVAAKRYERSGRYHLPPEYRGTRHAPFGARRRERRDG